MREAEAQSPKDMFQEWEDSDYFAEGANNKNLLAWYGFEETLWRIASNFDCF